MSDVTVAPDVAPSSAPAAPAANEAAINQSPPSSPSPIGAQAPQAPEKPQREHIKDPRGDLQRAFDRANNPPPKTSRPAQREVPKAAEAKMGHNQPPEETEKIDLRKRPQDIPRGERGQFAPRQPATAATEHIETGTTDAGDSVRPGEQRPYKQLPKHVPFAEPPPRISERARHDWADTPETVRGEFHRQNQEFAAAYQQYRGDHEVMNQLRPYHEMAQRQGNSLPWAMNNYVTMEHKLRADPIGGMELIVHNLNMIDPQTNKRVDLRDFCYAILSRTPEQIKQMQQGNVQSAAAQQIGALHQKTEMLENQLKQMHYQQQFVQTRGLVDQFAATRPRFDELGEAIHQELQLGFPLDQAYQRAERLYPATQAAQTRTTPAQTRPIDRSISGAPAIAPSNGAERRPKPMSKTPRDAVQNALQAFHGAGI